MQENNENKKTYWPHMILGFLMIGITLGYWTVKHAVQMPVQEANEYMMKYQQADLGINNIMEKKALFDKQYTITLTDAKMFTHKLENAKRAKEENTVLLTLGKNNFAYSLMTKEGKAVEDANVTFLLTRPHTVKDDIYAKNIGIVNGTYQVNDINISKAGRYTLQFKAKIGDAVGYSVIPAYLKP